MTLLRIATGCVLLWGGIAAAPAQVYPSRPITMVVPFAAGGPVDTVARILSEPMRATLGQSIIVENVTGAAGSIGVGRVARAAPDGYTLSIGHWSTHVVNGAIYPLPYDLLRDLEPIVLLPSNPMIVVSKNAVPAKNLNEFVGWIKANEGKVFSAGTAGAGSATHVAGVYFQNVTGTRFQFVPYRGTGPALQDLVAGQIDFIVDQASNSLQHVRDGKIRAYAVTASARLPSAPDIPTVAEAGLPSLDISVWYGLWAPKGTPKEIIAKLNAAAVQALSEPTVRQRFAELGLDVPPRDRLTPEALAAYQKAEIEKWWPVIRGANIKTE
jgi:tripartite-type tricarboxylate transporter receptor subunit TctC